MRRIPGLHDRAPLRPPGRARRSPGEGGIPGLHDRAPLRRVVIKYSTCLGRVFPVFMTGLH